MSRYGTIVEQVVNPASGAFTDATRGVHQECLYKKVPIADNSTVVHSGPCILYGIYVDTVLSAHACPIVDGSTTIFSLIASLAAGTNLSWGCGVRFETSLSVDPNDVATGDIVVFYKPL